MTEVPPELKPCPFCEGEGCIALGKDGESKKVWFVYCPRCGAHGPAGADPDDAAAVWNRRFRPVHSRDIIISEFREVLEHAEWDVKELDELVDQYSKRTVSEAIGGARAGIEDLEKSLAEFDAAFRDDPNAWYDATSSMTYELMNSIRRECERIDTEKKERKSMAKKKGIGACMMDNLERSKLFFDFVDAQRRYTRGQDQLDEVSRTLERMEALGERFRDDPAFTSSADATQDVVDSLKTLRYELAETVQAQKEKLEALVGDLRVLIFIGDDV